ncbi:MAG: Flagellar transcriptional regulator FlhC [Candidatus Gallionella acididurans]|uniref:Flagellar transcriptional regulator FlhC n=1 Tax=Candidatus Gallionella acididurans TaxID=1796491 RepID=A0A139BXR0_9PROT|nr:MAG: Flagellar transcriptional regulator FlhC [Candidatus Gallionella acididurans]
MAYKSVVAEAQQVRIAIDLIRLGARLQLLQEETALSRERLLKLYKEIKGESPSKGMLPYSTDWFISWQPNIHSSLFMDIYQFMVKHAGISGVESLITAYHLYLDQIQGIDGGEPVLSITRAWSLLRFFNAGMLQLIPCEICGGRFVSHVNDLNVHYVCGICHPPARAGKTRAVKLVAKVA